MTRGTMAPLTVILRENWSIPPVIAKKALKTVWDGVAASEAGAP